MCIIRDHFAGSGAFENGALLGDVRLTLDDLYVPLSVYGVHLRTHQCKQLFFNKIDVHLTRRMAEVVFVNATGWVRIQTAGLRCNLLK